VVQRDARLRGGGGRRWRGSGRDARRGSGGGGDGLRSRWHFRQGASDGGEQAVTAGEWAHGLGPKVRPPPSLVHLTPRRGQQQQARGAGRGSQLREQIRAGAVEKPCVE